MLEKAGSTLQCYCVTAVFNLCICFEQTNPNFSCLTFLKYFGLMPPNNKNMCHWSNLKDDVIINKVPATGLQCDNAGFFKKSLKLKFILNK